MSDEGVVDDVCPYDAVSVVVLEAGHVVSQLRRCTWGDALTGWSLSHAHQMCEVPVPQWWVIWYGPSAHVMESTCFVVVVMSLLPSV